MYIDWLCNNCGEHHITYLDSLTFNIKTELQLNCNSCNTQFLYKITSIKSLAKCSVEDIHSRCISLDKILFWE